MSAITIPNIAAIEKLQALVISIVSPETETAAQNYLTTVRLEMKHLTKFQKDAKKPYKEEIDKIDTATAPLIAMLKEKDGALERAILAYRNTVRLAAEEANRKAMEKYEKKVERVEAKAVEQGKPIPMVLPPAMVVAPQKSVQTEGAKQTVVKRKAWRMKPGGFNAEMNLRELFEMCGKTGMDEWWPDNLPGPEHFLLNTVQIGKLVRVGGLVPGIEVYEEESISVRG